MCIRDRHLEERGARELFEQLEMPLMWVLAEMERTGIRVDAEVLAEIARDLNARAAALEDQIFAGVGHRFNLASPKQLSEAVSYTHLDVYKRQEVNAAIERFIAGLPAVG